MPFERCKSQFRRSQVKPNTASNSGFRSVTKNSTLALYLPMQIGVMTVPVMLAEEPSPITTCSPWLSGVKGRSNARANLPEMKLAEAPVSSNSEIAAWWIPAFTLRTCEDAIDCSTQRLLSASTNTRTVLEVGGSRNSAPLGSRPVHTCVPGGKECTSTGSFRPGRLVLLPSLTTK